MEDDTKSIEKCVSDIRRKLERKVEPSPSESPTTIFEVPTGLRGVQKSAFSPEITAIGPWHRLFDEGKDHKIGVLLRFLEGESGEIRGSEIKEEAGSQSRDVICLKDLAVKIIESEPTARKCYSVPFGDLSRSDFARIMVIDGCFVIELLLLHAIMNGEMINALFTEARNPARQINDLFVGALTPDQLRNALNTALRSPDGLTNAQFREARKHYRVINALSSEVRNPDRLINALFTEAHTPDRLIIALFTGARKPNRLSPQSIPAFQRDMIKLENQIPFFLLQDLFSMITSENDKTYLKALFVSFFCSMLSLDRFIYWSTDLGTRDYAHPLELFRSSFIFSVKRKRGGRDGFHSIYMANPKLTYSTQDLQEVGVKIIRKYNSSLLEVNFDYHKGVLQIPPLTFDENMIVALLNFVAYEQGHKSHEPYFMNYLLFLDSLINTTKDVEILRKNGIIRYKSGFEKEVVDFFNSFGKEMSDYFDPTYLPVDLNAVNNYCEAYYRKKWRFWWISLKRERFSSPWTFLSLVAAIVLLILTMLQTFFTVFPYYHRN